MVLLIACVSLECGPGTKDVDGSCVPTADAGSGVEDSTPTDSATDSTADSGGETATETDSATETPPVEPLQVYILAGQSNMDGYGYYTGLAPSQLVADPRVPLYWSGWGEFRDLQAASYGGSVYVGPEVTFGRALADADVPVVLVKHAVGGTDLAAYWYPGSTPDAPDAGLGFSVLVDTMEAAALELDAAGEPWEWAGFLWMQGESDALDARMARAYEENLVGLISAVRTVADTPDLPALIGLIARESIWTYADTVRAAQQAVADADAAVVTVETDDLPRNTLDLAHYDGPSMRVMGQRFARAVVEGADIPAGDDAPKAAFSVTGGYTTYNFTGTCGWEFQIEEPISVTDIGGYGASYLTISADVGIWDAGGNLVLRANVPSWYDAPTNWRGSLWYVAVDPVRLDPGSYRIGIVSWTGDADRYLNDAWGTFGDGIGYVGGAYAEGYWLTYPSVGFASETVNFVGPGFLYVPGE